MVFAGIVGGLFTLAGVMMVVDTQQWNGTDQANVKQVSFRGNALPPTFDFKAAAESVKNFFGA